MRLDVWKRALVWACAVVGLVVGSSSAALAQRAHGAVDRNIETMERAKALTSYVQATRALVCLGFREGGTRRDAQREAKVATVLREFGFSRASYAAAAQRFSQEGSYINTSLNDACGAARIPSGVWTAKIDSARGDRTLKGSLTVQVSGSRIWGRLRVEAGHVRFGKASSLGLRPAPKVTPRAPHVRLEGRSGDELAYRVDLALEGEALVGELVLVYATGERYVAPVRATLPSNNASKKGALKRELPRRYVKPKRGVKGLVIY